METVKYIFYNKIDLLTTKLNFAFNHEFNDKILQDTFKINLLQFIFYVNNFGITQKLKN